jgi:hypothetical protein
MDVMAGTRRSETFLRMRVGIGSKLHDLVGEAVIARLTSSVLTKENSVSKSASVRVSKKEIEPMTQVGSISALERMSSSSITSTLSQKNEEKVLAKSEGKGKL